LGGTAIQRDALQLAVEERQDSPSIGRKRRLLPLVIGELRDYSIGQHARLGLRKSRTHSLTRLSASGAQNAIVMPSGEIAGAACLKNRWYGAPIVMNVAGPGAGDWARGYEQRDHESCDGDRGDDPRDTGAGETPAFRRWLPRRTRG
jgi:hypothetical protein